MSIKSFIKEIQFLVGLSFWLFAIFTPHDFTLKFYIPWLGIMLNAYAIIHMTGYTFEKRNMLALLVTILGDGLWFLISALLLIMFNMGTIAG